MFGSLFGRTLIALALAVPTMNFAAAQSFPEKPVELVVPWTAGGGSDILMRLVADATTSHLGGPMVVLNKPGAAGSVGLREVSQAKPDGYMLGMIATGFVALQYGNLSAPQLDDFEVIAYVGTDPAALAANPKTGWKTLQQLVDAARATPRKIRNAQDPPVGSNYLAISLMMRKLGIELTLIPYQGAAEINHAVIGGEVQTAAVTVPDAAEHNAAGRMHLLAVAGDNRHPMAPDVPTFTELGHPLVIGTMRAIVAPRGTPADRLAKLEAAILAGLNSESFRARAAKAGFSIAPRNAKDAKKFIYDLDEALYPVLLEADMIKVRRK